MSNQTEQTPENETAETEEEEINDVVISDDQELDEEFEYDENGDIIIPEISEGNEESEIQDEGLTDGAEESEVDESRHEPETDEGGTAEEGESTDNIDAKDAEIADLRKKIRAYELQGKDTLKKLGVDENDVIRGLAKLAAEAEDKPIEEYLKEREKTDRETAERIQIQQLKFEEKMRADLAEVHAAYPETRKYKTMREIPNFEAFGKARDAGFSPKQAYAAANPDDVRASVAAAVKRKSLNDTKKHLTSNIPKGSKDTSVTMSKSTLAEWRQLFPSMSDKEIVSLYKQTLK